MRFALTDDQLVLHEAVRDLLDKEPPDASTTWDALVAMGVTSVLVPEHEGGLGLDEVTMVAVLEATGYAALAFPITETAMVAAPLGIVGRMVAAAPAAGLVPHALDADAIIVGDVLYERDALIMTPRETVDPSRRAAIVEVRGEGRPLDATAEREPSSFDRAALGTAAQLVGLGQRMLDMTVGYVRDRHQFGVPVGSFQAVKHELADALKELAFARPAVYRAGWSMATRATTTRRDVSMAKAMASDAASFVARRALQCHGAIGYTVEYDLHRYLKRTWALARAWGDANWHRERVAEELRIP
jgi:alkylation response protein AidB-like acyl-CoA dehydrogenase